MPSSNCCFLTCMQISQEAGQVVWYFHLFNNFPQFCVVHTVKGFGIVNKADDFWNSLAFLMIQQMWAIRCLVPLPFLNPVWTSGNSSVVHVHMCKPVMENVEHYFACVWDECHCVVVWAFFSIAFPLALEWKLTFSSPVATAELSKCSLGISNFLEEISSVSHSVVFPLFLCIDCWGRLSYLSLLIFETLHWNGYIVPFLLCFSLLFFS